MGKTRGMGTGKVSYGILDHRRPLRRISFRERALRRKRFAELRRKGSQVTLPIQSDKSLKGIDHDQTALVSGIDIQEKSSSDVVTSTSKPQTPSLEGTKKTLVSQVSLLRCSACMQIIPSDQSLKGSPDQDQTTLVSQIDIHEEKLSSDIVSSTSNTHQGKHLQSSSKMPKVFLNKKKKKSSRKAVSTT